jgi:hypothetical protein
VIRSFRATVIVCAIWGFAQTAWAQQYPQNLYQELSWRMIGPFRGGRTRAVAGVPGQPNVFYIGAVDGGVWKSTDYGRTWNPIFDGQPSQSIGAIAVSPSNPEIIYVASGEGLQRPDLSVGNGIYKSTDAGKTWAHLGLRDGQQIPALAIDPRNPNRIFAAVLGKRSCTKTKTPAVPTLKLIHPIQTSSTPHYGNRGSGRGRTTIHSRETPEDCSSRPTAATSGKNSRMVSRKT